MINEVNNPGQERQPERRFNQALIVSELVKATRRGRRGMEEEAVLFAVDARAKQRGPVVHVAHEQPPNPTRGKHQRQLDRGVQPPVRTRRRTQIRRCVGRMQKRMCVGKNRRPQTNWINT